MEEISIIGVDLAKNVFQLRFIQDRGSPPSAPRTPSEAAQAPATASLRPDHRHRPHLGRRQSDGPLRRHLALVSGRLPGFVEGRGGTLARTAPAGTRARTAGRIAPSSSLLVAAALEFISGARLIGVAGG